MKKSIKTSKHITHSKFIVILVVLLLIPVSIFSCNRYKDWDNAQLIRGLAEDFPLLVLEAEKEADFSIEQKVDCSITQEKFSSGIQTCEIIAIGVDSEENMEKAFTVFKNSELFPITSAYENKQGFNASYRNKDSCGFRTQERVYSTCITAVREANIDLAREVFLNKN